MWYYEHCHYLQVSHTVTNRLLFNQTLFMLGLYYWIFPVKFTFISSFKLLQVISENINHRHTPPINTTVSGKLFQTDTIY